MHAGLDLEVHCWDEHISVGTQNWNVLEDDIIREYNLSTLSSLFQDSFGITSSLASHSPAILRILGNHHALILSTAQITKNLVHLVDKRRVASQVLHFFIGDNKAANSLC